MATLSVSAFLALHSHKPNSSLFVPTLLPCRNVLLGSHGVAASSSRLVATTLNPIKPRGMRRVRSVEDETQVPEQEEEQASSQEEGEEGEVASSSEQQGVSVPVSASDTLTMFFQVSLFFFF